MTTEIYDPGSQSYHAYKGKQADLAHHHLGGYQD